MSRRNWTTRPTPFKLKLHVFEIRTLRSQGVSQVALAQDFRVTGAAISYLVRGKTYPNYPGPIAETPKRARPYKLREHVEDIRNLWAAGVKQVVIARKYGVTPGAIFFVVHGISYPDLPGPISEPRRK